MIKYIFPVGSLIIILMFAFYPPAFANRPEIDREFVHNSEWTLDCTQLGYDFKVSIVENGHVKVTTFFDKDDNPYKLTLQSTFVGTGTNSKTGSRIKSQWHGNDTLDLRRGVYSARGIFYHFIVPGHGTVVIDVGHLTIDAEGNVEFHGKSEPPFTENGSFICEGLDGK